MACTEISKALAMNAHVEVSALSGEWNQHDGEENNEAHNGPKKLENTENYLMWTLRETVTAFKMREIRFAGHAAYKIRKPHGVTL